MAALRLAGDAAIASTERQRLGLRRDLRLRRRSDFDAVFQRGRLFNDALLVLRILPNSLEHNRYGFVTSKRLGGAVVRNRVRRRLREIVRSGDSGQWTVDSPHSAPGQDGNPDPRVAQGYDIVLSAKVASVAASYQELRDSVMRLYAKGGLTS